jgi:hypothetical protein
MAAKPSGRSGSAENEERPLAPTSAPVRFQLTQLASPKVSL